MTSTLQTTASPSRRVASHRVGLPARRHRSELRHSRRARDGQLLGRYTDHLGNAREVILRRGAAGSTLVVDRDGASHGDLRLVAHLAADEPAGNAALLCDSYLADTSRRSRCRRLTAEDARIEPFAQPLEAGLAANLETTRKPLVDRDGSAYRLEMLDTGMSIPELRWCRQGPAQSSVEQHPVSMREAIAALESYEPARTLTLRALLAQSRGGEVSTTVLRAELARVQDSPIVLNRRLREVVLATVERQELSMSEIAMRCGRIKRDRRGNETGETSWLARRLGLLPEGGQSTPTPWIHSDVLALIARSGVGVSPREVEL
jgi:hypothetical protein